MRRNGPREYMPCLALFMQEVALPVSLAGPPIPSRSVFKSLCSRSGLLGRLARGCLVFGALVVGGAEASVPETGGSVEFSSLDRGSETGVPPDGRPLDSRWASGVPGASGSAASMG